MALGEDSSPGQSKRHWGGDIAFERLFQIEASKRRPLGCLLLSEGGLLFPPPMNPTSQPLGKAALTTVWLSIS